MIHKHGTLARFFAILRQYITQISLRDLTLKTQVMLVSLASSQGDETIHYLKVQLTPKIIFPLTKSTSFPNYFSEKIFSIDKIPAFLQAFKVVISSPTTEQNGIWVGLLVTSSKELGSKNSRDFDWASSAVKT